MLPANAYSPAPHAIGLTAFEKQLEPAGHIMQTFPLVSEYHPDVQDTGAADAAPHEEPAGHGEQEIAPADEYYSSDVPSQAIVALVVGHL